MLTIFVIPVYYFVKIKTVKLLKGEIMPNFKLNFEDVKKGDKLSFDLQEGRIKIVAVVILAFTQNGRKTIVFDTDNFGENTFALNLEPPGWWEAFYNLESLGVAENIQIVKQ
ncbi:MAG: hypothetical protein COT26_00390 [Candidatus Kerfeldbacteria bacterium CG08_land_8_20_14_0_20_43_14]|uniref:Uncharacterized protein n=1 Tax=Candidatus Kerfeldbacteria bacterium CG08_land_8_20_14_0_20_43_14 TaxID=2014246 RepID=A0A2H0YR96_9BACT|nr:MAG: hypothetical protein COT26_00390 [Candidatus Kerfeldbacteria bacterium CG08_land_8_20_14_0_20_43_14]